MMDVRTLFLERGNERYDEAVTQLQHALQCAALARRASADDEVVLAALLHDVGHLIARSSERPERHHGHWGAAFVRPWVPPRVAWLIEHHVVAKRYLCTVDPAYERGLSAASVRSLVAQGGRLTDEEKTRLESEPWFADAVRVRQWDEEAKDPAAVVPPLDAYAGLLERYLHV